MATTGYLENPEKSSGVIHYMSISHKLPLWGGLCIKMPLRSEAGTSLQSSFAFASIDLCTNLHVHLCAARMYQCVPGYLPGQ